MIITVFIKLVAAVVTALFAIFPTWTVDSSTVTSWGGVALPFGSLNGWVPEQELAICVGIVIAVRLFFLVWDGVLFLYGLVPFNG